MKPYLVKMLNEFIERDFSLGEMLEVIESLHDIEEDRRIRDIYRRREMWDDVVRLSDDEDSDRMCAFNILKKYSLDYEIDELL